MTTILKHLSIRVIFLKIVSGLNWKDVSGLFQRDRHAFTVI